MNTKQIKQGHCPECNHDLNDSYSESELYDGGKYWEMNCKGCGVLIQEHYSEVFDGFAIWDKENEDFADIIPPTDPQTQLIAAAPETKEQRDYLLEALKRLSQGLSEDSDDYPDSSLYRQTMDNLATVKAAIQRAEATE